MSANPDLRLVQSRIDPSGGLDVSDVTPQTNIIDPNGSSPLRLKGEGARFSITPRLVGKLEGLSRVRLRLGKLKNDVSDDWKHCLADPTTRRAIAQSVIASSEIEGEGLYASEIPWYLEAVTQSAEGVVSHELSQRIRAITDIYDTYVWALTLDRKSYIDFDLILELHSRMFVTSRAIIAGRLKDKEVMIRGAGYEVRTLRADRTAEFLRELCVRTNQRLINAKEYADESMLLVVSEFLLDFLAIHPFIDGNGRLARLLSTYLLERAGYRFARFYPLDLVILETRDRYYQSLFKAQIDWYGANEDLSPWVDYYVGSVSTQCQRALQVVANRGAS